MLTLLSLDDRGKNVSSLVLDECFDNTRDVFSYRTFCIYIDTFAVLTCVSTRQDIGRIAQS